MRRISQRLSAGVRSSTLQKEAAPMSEPLPRKRFQIHLSTAIVLMLVAGGILWANLRARDALYISGVWHIYGWPLDAAATADLDPAFRNMGVGSGFSYARVALDFCIALVILLAIWLLSEWLIHRSERG